MNIKLLKRANLLLVICPLLIFSLGYITLLSTMPDLAKNQIIFFLLGVCLYFVAAVFDYTLLMKMWKLIYIGSILLLILTFLVGEETHGSVRWIRIGNFSLQPSELAKMALIILLSVFIATRKMNMNKPLNVIKVVLISLPLIVLVVLQPDLGTSLVLIAIMFGVFFYSGLDKMYFIVSSLLLGVFSNPVWNLLKDYQRERILVFLNPSLDRLGTGYNVIQSMIALGSGGLVGRGFGHGTQTHLRFLPIFWTDFIFAAFAEEWGFVGVVSLVLIFCLLLYGLLNVATQSKDAFGSMLAIGTFVVFLVQFVINVGMTLGIMPVTGISLPIASYGGSSMLVVMFLLGVTQSVWIRKQ